MDVTAFPPFGTFEGTDEYEFVPGVHIRAIGGKQLLMCRVRYEPGKEVPRHSHEHRSCTSSTAR